MTDEPYYLVTVQTPDASIYTVKVYVTHVDGHGHPAIFRFDLPNGDTVDLDNKFGLLRTVESAFATWYKSKENTTP